MHSPPAAIHIGVNLVFNEVVEVGGVQAGSTAPQLIPQPPLLPSALWPFPTVYSQHMYADTPNAAHHPIRLICCCSMHSPFSHLPLQKMSMNDCFKFHPSPFPAHHICPALLLQWMDCGLVGCFSCSFTSIAHQCTA